MTASLLQFFHRPELRAARPGVDCHFSIRRRDRLPGQHPDLRDGAADAAGKILRTGASPGEGPEGVLDYPVLQGMERDDHPPPPALEQAEAGGQPPFQAPQLVVHRNPQGLEGPGRRVEPLLPCPPGDRPLDQVGELQGGLDGCLRPRPDDETDNPLCPALLAVLPDDPDELLFGEPVHQLHGGFSLAGVHPHVERGVLLKTESPLPAIQLVGRNPQVEQEAVDPGDAELREKLAELGEIPVKEPRPRPKRSEPVAGRSQRRLVPVEADQDAVGGRGLQDQGRMAGAAKGPVQVNPARLWGEKAEDLRRQDRHMSKLRHYRPSSARAWVLAGKSFSAWLVTRAHSAWLQISIFFWEPTNTMSRSSAAAVRKWGGISTRPCLSATHSTPGARIRRLMLFNWAKVKPAPFATFSSRASHSG